MSEAGSSGYKQPPKGTQFQKGQSGNPRGRPKNRRREIPYDAVLGQMVTIREEGRDRRVTAAEAYLLQLTQKGLAGDSAATRASLEALETARAAQSISTLGPSRIALVAIDSGADAIIGKLGIAFHKYPADEARTRWEINPWMIEAALERLGDKRLSEGEQREIWDAARTPRKVMWPAWWAYSGD